MGDAFRADLRAATSGHAPGADWTVACRRSVCLDRRPADVLWRAVDGEGEVLDILVQARRDKGAALRLMRKLLKNQRIASDRDVRAFHPVVQPLATTVEV